MKNGAGNYKTSVRCFVPGAGGDSVDLPVDESHHVSRVLRMGAGASVIVFDGGGHEWDATIEAATRGRVRVRLGTPRVPIAEPRVAVTLAIALLKGDAMSHVVRDATMLGAAAIVPFVSDHVALPEQALRARQVERWLRVAVASAKQCGRAIVPRIEEVSTFEAALSADADERILCVEPGVGARDTATPGDNMALPVRPPTRATVFVGPEGGWSASEAQRARDIDAEWLSLGPRVLRAEIAPAIALAVLWTRWGWN